jgi:hypothetical protein
MLRIMSRLWILKGRRRSLEQSEHAHLRMYRRKWSPPEGEALRNNADGLIIRDCNGQPLLTAWPWLRHCMDAEEAEVSSRLAARWPDPGS